jgi:hypothetical protein
MAFPGVLSKELKKKRAKSRDPVSTVHLSMPIGSRLTIQQQRAARERAAANGGGGGGGPADGKSHGNGNGNADATNPFATLKGLGETMAAEANAPAANAPKHRTEHNRRAAL